MNASDQVAQAHAATSSLRAAFRGDKQPAALPWVAPVGRLDKASEGLLLFTNDTAWASRITDPASHLEKVYHVQVNCLAGSTFVQRLLQGVSAEGEFLDARGARVLRQGEKNSWLEIVLKEGARLEHYRLQRESTRAFHVSTTAAKLGTNQGRRAPR